ncbi:MAG: 2-C-methyl-D-erythritol 4-phosphate cytidylyltransferase [Bacillota bacterium]|nr:2-C-methyl-D-erythritol 4-phosphate cytidylyltransferase [Bacillota bacterium]
MSVCALIAAAGAGRRMGAGVNKVFLPLRGEPVLRHTLRAFEVCDCVDDVIVIVAPDEVESTRSLVGTWGEISRVRGVVAGGATRQESVLRGLGHLGAACEIVVVHDGARPLIRPFTISRVVEAARTFGAAVVAVPVRDTTKVVRGGEVVTTLDRDTLWAAATPQAFRRGIIEDAHRAGACDGVQATDDSMLVERTGVRIKVIQGEYANIKITTPEDLVVAEALLGARDEKTAHDLAPAATEPSLGPVVGQAPGHAVGPAPPIRVGLGFDVHRLVPGRPLVLGGVVVPFDLGLEGHSDADVILHAIADAILGACGLGDIGHHFPDTDSAFAGISSTVILEKVRDLASEAGFVVNNVDAMLLAERPRIAAHVSAMRATVARILRVPVEQVSIKATTMEGMGFVGRGEGMACYATCSVRRTRE